MKIVTWNCNGAFRKKYHLLDEFGADIVIVQECEDPSVAGGNYENWAGNHLWKGENKNKGLGVFAQSQVVLKQLDWRDEGLQSFLPCRVNSSINLVAVWTKQASSPNFRYIGQLWKYLQLHKQALSENRCVVCGDFNSNKIWDKKHLGWNHSDVVRELSEINIGSIYHRAMNEEQGQESVPTLYMHRNPHRPYHIDYAFASEELFELVEPIVVGKRNNWLEHSDHMPMTFSIKA